MDNKCTINNIELKNIEQRKELNIDNRNNCIVEIHRKANNHYNKVINNDYKNIRYKENRNNCVSERHSTSTPVVYLMLR